MSWPPSVSFPATPITAQGSVARGGINPPRYFASGYYPPDHVYIQSGPAAAQATTTVEGIYYIPIYVWRNQAFRGMSNISSTASNNLGKQAMFGLYNDDSNSGGPGSLRHTFGVATFSTISAVNTVLNTVTLAPGRYWMTQWFATNVDTFRWLTATAAPIVRSMNADLGLTSPLTLGLFPAQTVGWLATAAFATTFANTAVTPSIQLIGATTAVATTCPQCYLFV